jgi:hypothetical protein
MHKIAGVAFPEDHTVMRIIFLNAARAMIEGVRTTSVPTGPITLHLRSMKILRKKQSIRKSPNPQTNRYGSEVIKPAIKYAKASCRTLDQVQGKLF